MTTIPQKPLNDQIQNIIARYRNTKTEEDRVNLSQLISGSGLPTYHKEAMMAILLSKNESELMLSLEMVRMQEKNRHQSMMMAIESRLIQERMQKPI